MRRPDRRIYRQMPVSSYGEWDNLEDVKTILSEHDNGYFGRPARLADVMLRDDRISAVLETRRAALLSCDVKGRPSSTKRKAQRICDYLVGAEDEAGIWDDICPPDLIDEMLRWGHQLGIAVAEIVWDTGGDEWRPRLKMWHPQFVRWDANDERYKLMTYDGEIDLPRVDEQPRSDGKWVVWAPFGYRHGWRKSFNLPLAGLYLARQWTSRDWSRWCEKHGLPVHKVTAPSQAAEEVKDAFFTEIVNMMSEGVAMVEDPGNGAARFDVELIEPQSRSFDGFDLFLSRLDTSVAVRVLGQNLTTEVKGGSFAAEQGHENVGLDRTRTDARIAPMLRQQVLSWWAEFNYGDASLAPVPRYDVEPPEDENKRAEMVSNVATALTSFQLAGARVNVPELLEQFGIPLADETPDDDGEETPAAAPGGSGAIPATPSAIGAVVKVNELRATMGLPPLEVDGELTIAEYQAKHGEVVAAAKKAETGTDPNAESAVPPPAARGEQPTPPDPPVPPEKTERDERVEETLTAIATFTALAGLAATKAPTGHAPRRTFADRATESGVKRGAAAMDLEPVFAAVAGAKSLEDVKPRLLVALAACKTGRLADDVYKARILSNLAGRATALRDAHGKP